MSRTRKAMLVAVFTYLHFALAIVSGIVLVPLILSRLGERSFGLWLASGELIAYIALTDLGVFAVLPWVIAAAHGKNDIPALRQLLANGMTLGALMGAAILAGGVVVWLFVPGWFNLTEADRAELAHPLLLLLAATAVSYPLRVFGILLLGLQDASFCGILAITQATISIVLTLALLLQGFGLYALAAAAVVPLMLNGPACFLRLRVVAPELLRGWDWPTLAGIGILCREGVGQWLAIFGVRLLAASNGLVITFLGHPEWVPIFFCTAKVTQLAQQLCWVLPDSALVGLAQLHAEDRPDRVREVVGHMIRVHLLLTGSAACLVLALNPVLVIWWFGPGLYGGHVLNELLAAGLIVSSLVHAAVTPVGVVGYRVQIGIATLLNGAVYLALALPLGAVYGLAGLAFALLPSSVITTLAWGMYLQRHVFGLTLVDMWTALLAPWLWRMTPALILASLLGRRLAEEPLWQTMVALVLVAPLYLWWVRPLLRHLPLPLRVQGWMTTLRLSIPETQAVSPRPEQHVP